MGKRQKIAIFGGSFNPVHNGHINLCLECHKAIHFDKILLIPTNIPPHKASDELISNEDRFQMLQLAVEKNPLFQVSDIEFRLSGISYTYNTVLALKQAYENAEFYLIIGTDMLEIFHKWYKYEELLKEVTLVVGARKKEEHQFLETIKKEQFDNTDTIQIVAISVLEISSTEIRQRIKDGVATENYLPEAVKEYIKAKHLYT